MKKKLKRIEFYFDGFDSQHGVSITDNGGMVLVKKREVKPLIEFLKNSLHPKKEEEE